MQNDGTRYLNHIHYFRAFAILNVIAVHSWHVPSPYSDYPTVSLINLLREVIFHGSTIYFIFISGFLFFYLSPKFDLYRYYRNKVFYVLLPYVFISTLLFCLFTMRSGLSDGSSYGDIGKKFLFTLLHGSAQIQYWYIPFVLLLFMASPLLLTIPSRVLKIIVIISCLLPLFGTRTGTQITPSQYLYFAPVYLLGAYAAMHYERLTAWVNRNMNFIVGIFISASVLLILLNGQATYIGIVNVYESFVYLQKMSLCIIMLVLFQKMENRKIEILNAFATFSFAIYFTHTILGNSSKLQSWYYSHVFTHFPSLVVPLSILYLAVTALATLSGCMMFKRIAGRRSRIFIGS